MCVCMSFQALHQMLAAIDGEFVTLYDRIVMAYDDLQDILRSFTEEAQIDENFVMWVKRWRILI